MKQVLISLLLAAVLLLGGCTERIEEPPQEPSAVESETDSSAPDVPEDTAPQADNPDVSAFVELLWAADPYDTNVYWPEAANQGQFLRLSEEMLQGMARIFAEAVYTPITKLEFDEAGYVHDDWELLTVDLGYDRGDHSLLRIYPIDNGAKLVAEFQMDSTLPLYLCDPTLYENLAGLLTSYTYVPSMEVQGNYRAIGLTAWEEAEERYAHLDTALELDDVLLCMWLTGDGTMTGYFEGFDIQTSESLYQFTVSGVRRVEKSYDSAYDYRIFLEDRVLYYDRDSALPKETFLLPEVVKINSSDFWLIPFDVHLDAGLLAYSGGDGVYLCGLDGGENRLEIANSNMPGVFGPDADEYLMEGDEYLYVSPLLLNGGRSLVSTMYIYRDQGMDSVPYGVSVYSMDEEALYHYPGNFVWLSPPAQRLNDKEIYYLGGSATTILDVETMEFRFLEYDFHELWTADYQAFYKIQWSLNEAGEGTQELVMCALDPAGQQINPRTLLSVTSEYLTIVSIMDNYVICQYGASNSGVAFYVLVSIAE